MKKFAICFFVASFLFSGCAVNIDWGDKAEEKAPVVPVNTVAPTISGVETPTLTEQLNPVDDYVADTTLIDNYYAFIEQGKLDDAFALKYEGKTSLATFKSWYKDTVTVKLRDMEDLGEHKYRFLADLTNSDESDETYKVTMEVIDGKLKTISSVAVPTKSLRLGTKGNMEYLYLSVKGKEQLIFSYNTLGGRNGEAHIKDYKLFQNDKFVSYKIVSTAEIINYIYSINIGRVVLYVYSPEIFGFTDDEKFFYACEGTGMTNGYVSIYKYEADKMTFYKGLNEGMAIYACGGYNRDRGFFEYTLASVYGDRSTEVVRQYYFAEDQVR